MLKQVLISSFLGISLFTANAATPPTMGWSSWNTYRVNISDKIIEKQAQAMKDTGLSDLGYHYINIDDGFFGGRGNDGRLLINKKRFPKGLKPVVSYIHGLGLKAGIYSDAGKNTCGSFWDKDASGINSGLYGHDQEDCNYFFKDLGFDFIKIDFCGGDPKQNSEHLSLDTKQRYTDVKRAIENTGRKDVRINICRWAFPGTWVNEVGSSWRISTDIRPEWWSIKYIIAKNQYLSAYAVGGAFNDMDMLEIGRGLTPAEERTHFGMWCMMSSPLLIGCDMTTIPSSSLQLIKNKELIEINQDSLCLQARPIKVENSMTIFAKDLVHRDSTEMAVAVYNPTDQERSIDLKKSDLDIVGKMKVRDVVYQKDLRPVTYLDKMSVSVPAHDTRIFRLSFKERKERTIYEAETAWLQRYQDIGMNERDGYAKYENNTNASCGAMVTYLGNHKDNWLEWRDVYSKEGGRYLLAFHCFSGEVRSFYCSVNGGDGQFLQTKSLSWNNPQIVEYEVNLHKGYNRIRLFNNSEWMPNVDKMVIKRVDDATKTNVERITTSENLLQHSTKVISDGNINYNSQKEGVIRLLDISGRIISRYHIKKGENIMQNIVPGVYYILHE